MARVRDVELHEVPADLRPVYRRYAESYGPFLNQVKVFAHRAPALRHVMGMLLELADEAVLPKRYLEIALVAVSKANECAYCVAHHAPRLVEQGLDPASVAAILDPQVPGFFNRFNDALGIEMEEGGRRGHARGRPAARRSPPSADPGRGRRLKRRRDGRPGRSCGGIRFRPGAAAVGRASCAARARAGVRGPLTGMNGSGSMRPSGAAAAGAAPRALSGNPARGARSPGKLAIEGCGRATTGRPSSS